MAGITIVILLTVWWVCWRPGMLDWYHDWRYMRQQKKRLDEIDVLEDLFRER